jgi:hypothetical protein
VARDLIPIVEVVDDTAGRRHLVVIFATTTTTATTASATATLALGCTTATAFATIALATTPVVAAEVSPSRARTGVAIGPGTARSSRTRSAIAFACRWRGTSGRPAVAATPTSAEVTTTGRTSAAWAAALRSSTATRRSSGSGGALFLCCTIDPYAAPVDLRTVELERVLGSCFVGVRDEAEPTGTTGIPVQDDASISHVPELGKDLLEALVVHRPRQAADEQFCRHLSSLLDPGVSLAPYSQGTDADCQRQPRVASERRNCFHARGAGLNFPSARIERSRSM